MEIDQKARETIEDIITRREGINSMQAQIKEDLNPAQPGKLISLVERGCVGVADAHGKAGTQAGVCLGWESAAYSMVKNGAYRPKLPFADVFWEERFECEIWRSALGHVA